MKTTFTVPENVSQLDPQTKRKATICNLFVNHQLTIGDVIRVLDESYTHAIGVLIGEGVIKDRRSVPRAAVDSSSRLGLMSKFKKPGSTTPGPKR